MLLGLAIAGGLTGWIVGRLQRRRWWLIALAVPLPFWLYLPAAAFILSDGGPDVLLWWVTGLIVLGLPMLSWIVPAGLGVLLARGKRRISPHTPDAGDAPDNQTSQPEQTR